jgi:galactokinase
MDSLKIKSEFVSRFNKEPLLFRSPARINIIGEHTDYNDGFVMPAAIDKEIVFAIAENFSSKARIYAMDLNDYTEFDINDTAPDADKTWSNYLRGVIGGLILKGISLKGFDLVFGGNIPLGAGVSSSAAIEGGIGVALQGLFKFEITRMELAKIGQRAEHEYVGVKCGLMDQFANLHGKKDYVMKFDCRSLEYEYIPFFAEGYSVLLIDTKVKHALASSEYNTRRAECESGVSIIQKDFPEVKKLRDVSLEMISKYKDKLNPVVYKRCRYVVEENNRVALAADALKNNDFVALGKLLYQSHQGLSVDYEVSCKELDYLVQLAVETKYVAGARMMGGGFGGCTINLVQSSHLEEYIGYINNAYSDFFGKEPGFYSFEITDGAGRLLN